MAAGSSNVDGGSEITGLTANGSQIFPLDENCTHYTALNQIPWDLQKYVITHSLLTLFTDNNLDIGNNAIMYSLSMMKAST
jgi:hypothetical protein